ncbi:hypothetical protein PMZ80_000519 [Knufia obscura]|uniref:Uncharacterized protein n=2 Tax=Knufia TaxID=430999 RepID=A0AAN8EIX7_9EURO|nr:hypothetical protein PMZ80_000519 [Knufia obscura]KAK5956553.1 hypothetical protein OHC33_002038 [Knufia fluminis]
MAIGALDITSPGFSLACTILVSMLAWMFETITNRPLASAMHLQAARLMSSRSFSHTPNSEDLFVIGCVERLVQDNGLSYAHGLRRPERQLVQIKSLDEARIRLIDLAQPLLRNPTVDDCLITATRRGLDEWRADFEIYRYTGAETLRAKRSVFLAHNMVGTYLDMLSPVVPEETPISPIGQRILDDIEHILDHEELDDIEWILSLIVGHMIDHTEAESEIHCRAQRLKTSSDDLHTRINRRQTQYASSVY